MKKPFYFFLMALLSLMCHDVQAQLKVHSNGRVSFQSTTTSGGVQILTNGTSSFEPNITTSYTALTQTKALAQLVRAWSVRYDGAPTNVKIRFYVTGLGDTYSNGYYTITPGGGNSKEHYPIENASGLISNLNGCYYDNNDFDGFEPDYIDNPNVAPEAVEGLMKDLSINKSVGISPEDLEAILPEAIRHDPEGMIYINYSAIVPVLVEAFKEQQTRIEFLENVLKENGLLKP